MMVNYSYYLVSFANAAGRLQGELVRASINPIFSYRNLVQLTQILIKKEQNPVSDTIDPFNFTYHYEVHSRCLCVDMGFSCIPAAIEAT